MVALAQRDGLVVFEASPIVPNRPIASPKGSPYEELNFALYRTPTAQHDQLIFTTTAHVAATSQSVSRVLDFGADRWLMITTAKSSLNGSLAEKLPWIVLLEDSSAR